MPACTTGFSVVWAWFSEWKKFVDWLCLLAAREMLSSHGTWLWMPQVLGGNPTHCHFLISRGLPSTITMTKFARQEWLSKRKLRWHSMRKDSAILIDSALAAWINLTCKGCRFYCLCTTRQVQIQGETSTSTPPGGGDTRKISIPSRHY